MSQRKQVLKSLNFDKPTRIPRQLWLPIRDKISDLRQLNDLKRHFPDDLVFCPRFGLPQAEQPVKNDSRFYVDDWGCLFERPAPQAHGSARSPLITNWEDLERWTEPEALLRLDRHKVNAFCRSRGRFVLTGTWVRLFERLQYLRGPENLLQDLKLQPPEFFTLLQRVHQFHLKELEVWAKTEVDALCLMDDWGSQSSLFISPPLFRQLFRPLYHEYASLAKHYKKYLFFHSDGFILDLLPDFIAIGVDAINCQVFLLGLEKLSAFAGRITFWGASDLPALFSSGQSKEVLAHCRQVYEALYRNGGFIAQAEFSPGIRVSQLKTYFSAWNCLSRKTGKNRGKKNREKNLK